MAELRDLKKQERNLRKTFDAIQHFLDTFDAERHVSQLDIRLQRLDIAFSEFHVVRRKIELLTDNVSYLSEADTKESDEERAERLETLAEAREDENVRIMLDIEDQYCHLKSELVHWKADMFGSATAGHCSTSQDTAVGFSRVKLPDIRLPTFSGKIKEWVTFRDTFRSLIHENHQQTTMDRFTYLKSSLAGEALQEISAVEMSSVNYDVAWCMLEKRYENTKLIVKAHLDSLFSVEAMKRENYETLNKLIGDFEKYLLMLDKMGENTSNWSTILVHMICSRLDASTLRHWETYHNSKDVPSYEKLIQFLRNHCSVLQSITPVQTSSVIEERTRVGVSHSVVQSYGKCQFCGEAFHSAFRCTKFLRMEVAERNEAVRRLKLCLNCLSLGHLLVSAIESSVLQSQSSVPQALNTHVVANQQQPQTPPPTQSQPTHSNTAQTFTNSLPVTQSQNMHTQPLPTTKNLAVQGIGGATAISRKLVHATIHPRLSKISSFIGAMNFYVLSELTTTLPTQKINVSQWTLPADLILADPQFFEPGQIDMIIGAEHFFELLSEGRSNISIDGPILQNTVFGWIIAGRVSHQSRNFQPVVSLSCTTIDIHKLLTRFWELDTCRTNSTQSVEETACERLFDQTTARDDSGKFVVSLPKRQFIVQQIGDSKTIAMRRFAGLEKRFQSNPDLMLSYAEFIREYQRLGHMKEVTSETDKYPVFYLPHHAVLKPDSTTTKLRVVFDGSCKSSSGVSLNDALMVGPVVQEDLLSIIIRFRLHPIAVVADVEKMYRMVMVQPADQRLQRILWRDSVSEPVRMFQLTTVTYGTASAPYLATKCLQRLAEDGVESFPRAARALKEDFYIDDMLSGADNIEDGKELTREMIELTNSGGFTLRKFWSNAAVITKRTVLADAARLFDPLGLVGPVVVIAKIFLQELWKHQCDWDDSLPEEMQSFWQEYRRNLIALSSLSVPRWVAFRANLLSVEVHGFCDASEKAYGACLYVRCTTQDGKVEVRLLAAKSRVAPLEDLKRKKKKQTIPRLELSSALLLSHLYDKVRDSIKIQHTAYFWTDSTIVMYWLASLPSRWQMFVANRVSEIQHLTKGSSWNHVAGVENPADIISRGMTPAQLQYQRVWFDGPLWMLQDRSTWKVETPNEEIDHSLLEEKSVALPATTNQPSDIFALRSSLSDLIRRFIHNIQQQRANGSRKIGSLSHDEHEQSMLALVRLSQKESFSAEITALQKGKPVSSSSEIIQIHPTLVEGFLRVGGRLRHAPVSTSRKHPFVLSHHHPLSSQLLIASVRERYWLTRIRRLTNTVIHECVSCFRSRPRVLDQLMADLPSERVTPAPPFLKVGVDYCGPFQVVYPIRRTAPRKYFVSIFVCLVTKAVHLELVGDLTSAAFLAAFKRFVARRGIPALVMCDNALNFAGAKRELDELSQLFNNEQFQQTITRGAQHDGIEFRFIPPRSPNFGGLWEAAVKSFKGHFKRTIGNRILQHDEMQTVVAQIEAILNSRPLTPISNDTSDFEALTPGHFLIQRPLTAVPEPSLEDIPDNRLTIWQRSQDVVQRIWKKWSTQYLSDLHNRTKWTRQRNNIFVGTMVLIKDDNLPPLKWRLGRVTNVIAGPDGNVRVVAIRTKDGVYERGSTLSWKPEENRKSSNKVVVPTAEAVDSAAVEVVGSAKSLGSCIIDAGCIAVDGVECKFPVLDADGPPQQHRAARSRETSEVEWLDRISIEIGEISKGPVCWKPVRLPHSTIPQYNYSLISVEITHPSITVSTAFYPPLNLFSLSSHCMINDFIIGTSYK
ncbi:uncharacterized protein LOC131681087 [Topomyia yanbarensis]|uniref:uncharacterized protein LOC131681087 n=1 Tax=Topomyia yanbarensis TaxID=2498891 RepID=UPI00273C7B24|nr:uncharacterized protein LOC131681087 [Topomyia yanbarensis]